MASDPLEGLIQSINEASIIPPPVSYKPSNEDPFFRLIQASESATTNTSTSERKSNLNEALSERTRQAILKRPLQGPARLEAVDLALKAINNPNKTQIEKILDILISG